MVCSINQMTAVRSDLADLVGTRICGPSCVAMALQTLDKYPEDEERNNIEWLLVRLLRLHLSDTETICYVTKLNGQEAEIPVDIYSDINKYLLENKGFVVKKPQKEYRPIFSLVRGYDHRGSERVFGEFGLRAGYWERFELNDLKLKLDGGALLMLSVTPRSPAERNLVISKSEPTQSHVVLVTKYKENSEGGSFQIMDPAYDIRKGLLPKYELSESGLLKRLNWKGSWVKKY